MGYSHSVGGYTKILPGTKGKHDFPGRLHTPKMYYSLEIQTVWLGEEFLHPHCHDTIFVAAQDDVVFYDNDLLKRIVRIEQRSSFL